MVLALGQAVNLAACLAKFPQATLNHDRNAVYSSLYGTNPFEQASLNEVMGISKEVMADCRQGLEQKNNGNYFYLYADIMVYHMCYIFNKYLIF